MTVVLGFCESCECLKPIRATAQKLGSRECDWRPYPHDVLRHCCGAVVDREDNGVDQTFGCRKCGCVPEAEVHYEHCTGDAHDIRNHKQPLPDLEPLVSE